MSTENNNETPFGKGISMSENLLESIEQWVLPVYKGDDVASLVGDATDKEDKADDLASAGKHEDAADLLRQAASNHDAAVSAYKRVGDGEKFGAHAREAARLRDKAQDLLDAKNAEGDIANEINKGGPGSGPEDGHPFRGNRWTSAVGAAEHHNPRRGTENFDHGQHLDAAKAHLDAASRAMASGHYNEAGHHYDEAAFHAASATSQIQAPTQEYPFGGTQGTRRLGEKTSSLYESLHSAGESARAASRDTGRLLKATAGGADSRVLGQLRQQASQSQALAHASANEADAVHSSLSAARVVAGDPTLSRRTGTN